MSFIESPRFPEEVSAWALGGPMFQTLIAQAGSGAENRNSVWTYPLCKWNISNGLREIKNSQLTVAFHRNVLGRAIGFRFKDPVDYAADLTTGVLGTSGLGTGLPAYQLWKNYAIGSYTVNRKIVKPCNDSSLVIQRNGSPVTAGAGAGNYAIDYTTGIVSFVPDSTSGAVAITTGNSTIVQLSSNMSMNIGQVLYLSGFGGANAGSVNNQGFTISSVSGANLTLGVNTNGQTITVSSGQGAKYPQAAETLVWSGNFDVPVRFDDDWLQTQFDPAGLLQFNNVMIQELRL